MSTDAKIIFALAVLMLVLALLVRDFGHPVPHP